MIDIAPIQAFDHELARESEILANFYRLFVDDLRSEILCDAAVVYVTEFVLVVLVIEQIVHIHVVNVTLDRL